MNRTDLINIAGQLRALLLEGIQDVSVKFERVKGTAEDRELEFSFLITGEGATPNGGDVFAGSTIYDLLSSYKGNILIRVVGMAASAASVIACAGTSEIVPTAMIMIHNVSSYTEGDYNSMLHSAEVLQKANKAIATAYCRKTGLSEKELLSLMDKETYITAEEAVKQGFIDKIAEYEETSSQNKLALAASITGLLPEKTISKIRAERAKAQAKLELIKIKRSSASTRSSCG